MSKPSGYISARESPFTMFGRPTYNQQSTYTPGTLQRSLNAYRSPKLTRKNPRNTLKQTVSQLENTVGQVKTEVNDLELVAARKKLENAKAVSNAATQKRRNMERSSTPREKEILAAYGQLGAPGRPGITGAVPGAYSASRQRQAAETFGQASIAEQGRGFRGPLISGTASQQAQDILSTSQRVPETTATTGANNRPTPQLLRPLLPAASSETQPNPRPTVDVRPIGPQLVPSSIPTDAFRKRPVTPSVPVNTSNTLRAEREAAINAAATARTRITTLEGQIAALTGPNAANRRADLQRQLNAERARANEAVSGLSGYRSYATTQTARAATLEGELATARAALAAAQAGADPAEITRLGEEVNRLTGELDRAQHSLDTARRFRNINKRKAAAVKANTESELATAKNMIDDYEARLKNAHRELNAATASGSLTPAMAAVLQSDIVRIEAERNAARAERNAAKAAASAFGLGALDPTAAAALQAQLAAAQAEITSLKAMSSSSSSIGKKGPCAPGSGWRCQKPTKGGRRRIGRKRYTRR